MSNDFTPPLGVYFIWNPADANIVDPILNVLRRNFARDLSKPFSRNLNLPLFFFSSQNPNDVPADVFIPLAEVNVIFVFTSSNTLGRDNWNEYIENIPSLNNAHIVPIAIDKNGLNHSGSLASLNCIRAYGWPTENAALWAVVSLAHELYRFGLSTVNSSDIGKNSSIKIFLSHAKMGDTGRLHAQSIKQFIDNTNMRHFFDTTEISAGFSFEEEIEKHVVDATMIAIESDAYYSRYWCQREILIAKQHNRPLVVLNCLDDYEDRIFPAASNVPCIHVSAEPPLSDRNILRILSATIIETIRYNYTIKCLDFYISKEWIPQNSEVIARPPEIRQVLTMKNNGVKNICYPEPPIYSEEADWHQQLDVNTFTPLWNISDQDILAKSRVGISISDIESDGFSEHHLHETQLVRLAQDLSRHLLARSATLLYGGDLRPGGFTEFILDEASILQERTRAKLPHVENHLAWPLYISEPEIVSWRAKYRNIMDTKEHSIPEDISDGLLVNVFLIPNTPQNKYIWSRCLTSMRENSIKSSTARVCAGGKLFGYKGKMPGVLEEIVLAIEYEKPLFLLGAFGGVTNDVSKVILDKEVPESLTTDWQISYNSGYADLQAIANSNGNSCNYESLVEKLKQVDIQELASRAGLSSDEYKRLMLSPFIDECLYLILKGLSKLSR